MSRTYGSLAFRSNTQQWVMDEVEPHVVMTLKRMFDRIPKADPAPFLFPADQQHAKNLEWFMQRYPMRMTEEDRQRLENGRYLFDNMMAEMERILAPTYQPQGYKGLRPGQSVRAYQEQAVEVLIRSRGLALCDEVGLGKSYVTAAAALTDDALPAVIVCNTHLQSQWGDVFRNFTTLFPYPIKGTKPYDLPAVDVYIIRYSQLVGWADYWDMLKPKLVVFDEIQELRTGVGTENNPVLKGLAARRLSRQASMRLGLSATPIYNYGDEMYNIMSFLNEQVLGKRHEFITEWCKGGKSIDDKEALGAFLREQFVMLRRTKRDVSKEIPLEPNKIVKPIDYDQKAVADAETLARQLAVQATTGSFHDRGQAIRELDVMMRKLTGIAKAKHVAAYVRMIIEGGEPVVLFGWHRDVYDIWREELKDLSPVFFTGSESAAQKQWAVDQFRAGKTDLFIMSLRSGAGLNGLQERSSICVFGELDWSPGVHHQCLSDDTEILTPDGFKGADAVAVGDIMYGFDVKTGAIHETPVLAKVDRPLAPDEQMFEVETKRASIRVTGGHRMVVRRKQRTLAGVTRGDWEFTLAEQVAGKARRYVPTCGMEAGRGVPLRDCDLRLIGWFISDGNIGVRGTSLNFYQGAHQPWNADLVDTLNACGLRWTVHNRPNGPANRLNIYTVSRFDERRWRQDELDALTTTIEQGEAPSTAALDRSAIGIYKMARRIRQSAEPLVSKARDGIGWDYLADYLDKDLSSLLGDVTRSQLLHLLHGLNMGDGNKGTKNYYRITSVNKTMLDRLQSLCVRRGLQAKIIARKALTSAGNVAYDIKIFHDADTVLPHRVKANPFAPVEARPDERVWCVTNELSTIITRRAGKVAIVGNCIGRLDREGQKNLPVTALFLVADDGADPPMMEILGIKANEAQQILDPSLGVTAAETDESHLRKLVDRYLTKNKKGKAP